MIRKRRINNTGISDFEVYVGGVLGCLHQQSGLLEANSSGFDQQTAVSIKFLCYGKSNAKEAVRNSLKAIKT